MPEIITIVDMERRLMEAKEAYYNSANPIMTDNEYDTLEERLRKSYPQSSVFKMVGAKDFNATFKHTVPMLSQEKALSDKDAFEWTSKRCREFSQMDMANHMPNHFVASTKLDGMSMSLHYENGILIRAIARGDGEFGSDKTIKLRHIVPSAIDPDFTGEIRGEVALSGENLAELNKILPQPYQNPRNGVAGLMNDESVYPERLKFADFIAFALLSEENDFFSEDMSKLATMGFSTVFFMRFVADENSEGNSGSFPLADVLSAYKAARETYKYPLDGIVIRPNSNRLYKAIGRTSHHPKGSLAWKFPAESAVITLKAIEWSCGSRDITPVGIFDPVTIDGAIISRVSLKSVKNMVEKDIRIGERYEVVRSGGVIPWLKQKA